MKVRIIKPVRMKGAPMVQILPDSVVELPDDTGYEWLKTGTVEIVMRPAKETAMLEPGGQRAPVIEEPIAPATSNILKRNTRSKTTPK